ncbi:hypothetical protein S83_034167 [Arachis hypogaea]
MVIEILCWTIAAILFFLVSLSLSLSDTLSSSLQTVMFPFFFLCSVFLFFISFICFLVMLVKILEIQVIFPLTFLSCLLFCVSDDRSRETEQVDLHFFCFFFFVFHFWF